MYTLEKYNGIKTRYKCPSCEMSNQFTKYINTETEQYLDDKVGICNRVIKCGYHYSPKEYFSNKNTIRPFIKQYGKPVVRKKPSFHSIKWVHNSLKNRENNNLIRYLKTRYSDSLVDQTVNNYKVGTGKNGETVFWQIDNKQRVCAGKIIPYNRQTGKRTKYINWVHKKIDDKNFNLNQCLFGLHLAGCEKYKKIAVVESEKTALVMNMVYKKMIWVACGSINNLSKKMLLPIKDRKIILYPDSAENRTAFNYWCKKSKEYKNDGFSIEVSNVLENVATENQQKEGFDLADYFI